MNHKTIKRVELIVRQRPDFMSSGQALQSDTTGLELVLRGNKKSEAHSLFICKDPTENGSGIVVFHLNAGKVPTFLKGSKICATLNREHTKYGEFHCADGIHQRIMFVLPCVVGHHGPEAELLNRLIDTALERAHVCRTFIHDLEVDVIRRFGFEQMNTNHN